MGYHLPRPAAKIDIVVEALRMPAAVDRRELTFKALAGLIGGAIGWLPVEIASHGHSLTEAQGLTSQLAIFVSAAVLAGMIGGLILAAEDQQIEWTPAVQRRFLRGFLICLLVSLPGNYLSDSFFTSILTAGGWSIGHEGSTVYLIFGRVVSWSLMGLMLGIGVGLASGSPQNIAKGGLGGVIGGFVGGIAFDLIDKFSPTGLMPRLIGYSAIGLAIGLFIGLVQELTKRAWIAVEAGRLKGRQFRLESNAISVGRAEENPIGLFGDPAVQPRHAIIERKGENFTIRNLAVQAGTVVNGNRVETVELREGDRIQIGNYVMSFHSRLEPATTVRAVSPAASPIAAPAPAASVSSNTAMTQPCLMRANGDRLSLKAGAPTRIGRALDNDIVLNDASVSRHHAVIEARNGAFVVRDLGSQNGTWIGGSRIAESNLARGDAIRIGDAAFVFHA